MSFLPDRLYNLDKKGNRMLMAYRDTVDPEIIAKFQYLQNNVGLSFTNNFSEMINILFKT